MCVEERKVSYAKERRDILSKSPLDEGKQALFNMLTYQPALIFFQPVEAWWDKYIKLLIAEDYLSPGEMNGLAILWIRPKAKIEHAKAS